MVGEGHRPLRPAMANVLTSHQQKIFIAKKNRIKFRQAGCNINRIYNRYKTKNHRFSSNGF